MGGAPDNLARVRLRPVTMRTSIILTEGQFPRQYHCAVTARVHLRNAETLKSYDLKSTPWAVESGNKNTSTGPPVGLCQCHHLDNCHEPFTTSGSGSFVRIRRLNFKRHKEKTISIDRSCPRPSCLYRAIFERCTLWSDTSPVRLGRAVHCRLLKTSILWQPV